MKQLSRFVFSVLVLALTWVGTPQLRAQTLLVSAAASLTNVLPAIAAEFERAHPGLQVKCNFAGSGALQQQIEKGAPVDVFISAAQRQMKALHMKRLIDTTTRKYVCGDELVLIVPSGGHMREWNDLLGETVQRIAIADPASVPAGMYAQQALTSLGLWDRLKYKFVYAENVRQALEYVEGRNVEAGIVYHTDALIAKHSTEISPAPEGTHEPILYPAVVVVRSPHREIARQFIEYLTSASAQKEFQKWGFLPGK